MKKNFKLGVIGSGFMATAIIKGIINSKILEASNILVSDISLEQLQKVSALGVKTTLSNIELANNCEFILFAVKPQTFQAVLTEIESVPVEKVISIMAGIKKERIKSVLKGSSVARCMPNTPCSISSGAMGLDVSEFNGSDKEFIINIFKSLGALVLVEEDKLNAVTGISGSAPAYFYLFCKGLIEAGVSQGLTEEESKTLVVNTMIGSGNMLLKNPNLKIDDLINAVCSKGGTTIEAIGVYNESELTKISKKAVEACVKRAKELENQ